MSRGGVCRTFILVIGLVALVGLVGRGSAALPSAGSLDRNFGVSGKTTLATRFGEEANAVALQADGKIVVAGGYEAGTVIRYTDRGSLDSTFGNGGMVMSPIGPVRALVVQADGLIVLAGAAAASAGGPAFAVARLRSNGSLDSSFGAGGVVRTSIGSGAQGAKALAIEPDRKIVALGTHFEQDSNREDLVLIRYLPNGSRDVSFGSGGIVERMAENYVSQTGLAFGSGGKIITGGSVITGMNQNHSEFVVDRFKRDGSSDSTFGNSGEVTTQLSGGAGATGIIAKPNGMITAAGYGLSNNSTRSVVVLVRYRQDGSLDSAFGSHGIVTTALKSWAVANAIALQPNGKAVIAGELKVGTNDSDFLLARYLPDGSLDPAFGAAGIVRTSFSPVYDGANALALQSNGRIVAAGYSYDLNRATRDYAVARYFGDSRTLTVSKSGKGPGKIVSDPIGLACKRSCTAEFADQSAVSLSASSKGSKVRWGGPCAGKAACIVHMSTDRVVTGHFSPLCVVPRVVGKRLHRARKSISAAFCRTGWIHRVRSRRTRGRVLSQRPYAGTVHARGTKVALKVSKGKRA